MILRSVAFDQPAQHAHFAIFQPDIVLDFALADDRLLDSADVASSGDLRNVDGQLHADFAVRMHARRHVDIHADVDVLELRVHQRVHHARPPPTPTPTPAWKLPVATGTRCPIFNEAFSPSLTRIPDPE